MSPSNKRTKSAARKPPSRQSQGPSRSASRPAARASRPGRSGNVRWVAVAIALAIAVAIVVATMGRGSKSKSAGSDSLVPKYGRAPAPASLVASVTSIPEQVYNAVGLGTGELPHRINESSSGTKPAILFVGAEFCPYCAAERWAIVNALGRFGTFADLKVTHSSSSDVFANTETFSFYQSSYTSPYISFTPVEVQSNQPQSGSYATLQLPTAQQQQIWQRYTTGYPFLYFAGRYVATSTYDPGVLANKTHAEIAAALRDPNNAIAKGAIGTANGITAAICRLTNNRPSNVCGVPSIATLARQLGT